MAIMLVSGLSLGFITPSLTVFAQQTAEREHLGIAKAMLQSLRLVFGMVGTVIVGTLVTRSYTGGVEQALSGANGHPVGVARGGPAGADYRQGIAASTTRSARAGRTQWRIAAGAGAVALVGSLLAVRPPSADDPADATGFAPGAAD
ncbi:exported hypothetical protein [Cupriavidus taiwanensis]|uniref:Uncharacterized protein n=1 Tax=Cupriavidus taiwanensis TaxID=164546 RepID=A0A375JCA0_9BURK|nr:exported hypothetical protein [Cupriavidus taiwanensis]